MFVLVSHSCN